MLYPSRFQVRHSTVLVIVLLLMGSVLYEVTRTESAARQSAARTQDISLPAVKPVEHKIRPVARPDYIGRAAVPAESTARVTVDGEVALPGAAAASAAVASAGRIAAGGSSAAGFGSSSAPGRVRSSGSSGYAAGSFGMSGVGAWGGASGMVRPSEIRAAQAARPPRAARPAATRPPATRRAGSGGGATGAVATQLLPGGFTTGAAAVVPGAVVAVQDGAGKSPGASPAATPEPMSMLLMGTGLAALYGVRRRLQ